MRFAVTTLVLCVAALLALGMVMLYSASMGLASSHLLMKQLASCTIGLLACVALAWSDYRWLRQMARPIYVGAVLLLVKWVKALENGMDYSLMNTTRHSLFLITSREEKYKAQAVTKTFFHRSGDVLSAVLVFLGTTFLAFQLENFAMVSVALALIWIVLGVLIAREHKKLSSPAA